jgi:hypothetical protein
MFWARRNSFLEEKLILFTESVYKPFSLTNHRESRFKQSF